MLLSYFSNRFFSLSSIFPLCYNTNATVILLHRNTLCTLIWQKNPSMCLWTRRNPQACGPTLWRKHLRASPYWYLMRSTGCAVQQLQNPKMEYSPHNERHTHARLDKQSLHITYPCILSYVHRCSPPFLRRTCSSRVAAFVLKIMSFCALDTNASVFPACNNTQCQCKRIACHRGEWIRHRMKCTCCCRHVQSWKAKHACIQKS